ncbi:MAG: hypothetical protein ACXWEI_12540, partial [Mycobacterium sp.]
LSSPPLRCLLSRCACADYRYNSEGRLDPGVKPLRSVSHKPILCGMRHRAFGVIGAMRGLQSA